MACRSKAARTTWETSVFFFQTKLDSLLKKKLLSSANARNAVSELAYGSKPAGPFFVLKDIVSARETSLGAQNDACLIVLWWVHRVSSAEEFLWAGAKWPSGTTSSETRVGLVGNVLYRESARDILKIWCYLDLGWPLFSTRSIYCL